MHTSTRSRPPVRPAFSAANAFPSLLALSLAAAMLLAVVATGCKDEGSSNDANNGGNNVPVGNTPTAVDDGPIVVAEDSGATNIDVTANDTDPEMEALTVISVSTPGGGTAVINGNNVDYTPYPDFAGADSFTYTIRDPGLNEDTATVSITVTGSNDTPVARDDFATAVSGSATVIDVRDNDVDVDGDTLTVTATTDPTNQTGAVTTNGSTVTYTPPSGFTGTAVFTYTVQDPSAATDTATVTVQVVASFMQTEVLFEFPPANGTGTTTAPSNTSAFVVVFSAPIDANSLTAGVGFNGSAFLSGGGGPVSMAFVTGLPAHMDRRVLVFTLGSSLGSNPLLAVWAERSNGNGFFDDNGNFINADHTDARFQGFNDDPAVGFQWTLTGTDTTPPAVSSAIPASGSSANDSGTEVVVTFTEPINPATLSGNFTVSDGIGAVPGDIVPTLDTMRTVTFLPQRQIVGTVSVTIASIEDLAGNQLGAGANYTFSVTTDTTVPVIDRLTLDDIPTHLNGDPSNGGGYPGTPGNGGRLTMAPDGFTIDIDYHDPGGSGVSLDKTDFVITSSADVGGQTAGTNLAPLFADGDISLAARKAVFLVQAGMAFSLGTHTLSVQVRDNAGNISATTTFTIDVVNDTSDKLPFDTQVTWHLLFDRDHETTVYDFPNNNITSPEDDNVNANATADFLEDLEGFGFRSANGTNNVNSGGLSMNDAARNFLINRIIFHLYRQFGQRVSLADGNPNPQLASILTPTPVDTAHPVNIRFQFTAADPGGGNARMAFGGTSTSNTLGRAIYDRQNDTNTEDNGVSTGATSRGIFTLQVLHGKFDGGAVSTASGFAMAFHPTSPFAGAGGTPIGNSADDPFVLDPQQNPSTFTGNRAERFRVVMRALDAAGMAFAATAAHEIGHSLGLTANGSPMAGLYGQDSTAFPGSNSHHIELGTFTPFTDSSGENLMSASGGLGIALSPSTRFNRLTRSYFQNHAIADPGN